MPDGSAAPPQDAETVLPFDHALKAGLELCAVRPTGAATSCESARRTLSLAPVARRPVSEGLASAERRSERRSSAVLKLGLSASTSAAAPATCGEAIDVP